jgi:hypothetical protein
MNKTELLADMALNVLAVGDSKLIEADIIGSMRTYDYVVYVLQEDGTVKPSTQSIVIYDEDGASEAAYYSVRIVKNYAESAPELSSIEVVLGYLQDKKANAEFKDYALSGVIDGPDSRKVGIFTITNNDDSLEKAALTTINGVVMQEKYRD